MKISKLTITATIPVGQYANIQPSLEMIEIESIDGATNQAMDYFKDLWERFGTTPLKEVKIKSSSDKINEIL